MIDLNNPEHAYFIGFVHADGHLAVNTQNRGKLFVEILKTDVALLYKFQKLFPVHTVIRCRHRVTNFGVNDFAGFAVYDRGFREELSNYVPIGKKSTIIKPPSGIAVVDYLRGYIDGDGSVGVSSANVPFICLSTASEQLKDFYVKFLHNLLGYEKHVHRNTRDRTYNIVVSNEDAQILACTLWYPGCSLYLERKFMQVDKVKSWTRTRRKVVRRRHWWTADEIEYLRQHNVQDCLRHFQSLTASQVKCKHFRVRHEDNKEEYYEH